MRQLFFFLIFWTLLYRFTIVTVWYMNALMFDIYKRTSTDVFYEIYTTCSDKYTRRQTEKQIVYTDICKYAAIRSEEMVNW